MPRKILAEVEGEANAPAPDDKVVESQPAETEEIPQEGTDEVEAVDEVEPPSLATAGMTHCTTLRRLHMHDKIYEIGEDIVLEDEQALEIEAKGNVTIV